MIIGISGRIGSGKDTVAQIIQYVVASNLVETRKLEDSDMWDRSFESAIELKFDLERKSGWQVKKFADKLKDIVALLIGCTREQLEDREFKEKELPKEWNKIYKLDPIERGITPRLLMQLVGTECGRNTIHQNIWVNSLFADYKAFYPAYLDYSNPKDGLGVFTIREYKDTVYPNWIISDMRFLNELGAVKDRGGITIRVNRFNEIMDRSALHESEIALDYAEFDYTIDNIGTINELEQKVKEILIKEQILLW